MKKTAILFLAAVAVAMLPGCYIPTNHFSGVSPSIIFTNTAHTSYVGEKITDSSKVKVLSNVKGSASSLNIMMLVSAGDSSVTKAKRKALEMEKSADEILNMEVTSDVCSLMGIFTVVTTTVEGKAVQYPKPSEFRD